MTDFATFGAPKTASVFGTAVASTPFSLAGGKAAFGGMQRAAGRSAFDEEDEEEDDGRQKVELREDSISLDQVCDYYYYYSFLRMIAQLLFIFFLPSQARRIAMQSAWRSTRI